MAGKQLDCCIPKRRMRGKGLQGLGGSGLGWSKPWHGLAVGAFGFGESLMEVLDKNQGFRGLGHAGPGHTTRWCSRAALPFKGAVGEI